MPELESVLEQLVRPRLGPGCQAVEAPGEDQVLPGGQLLVEDAGGQAKRRRRAGQPHRLERDSLGLEVF